MINDILTGNRIKNYNNKNLEAMPVEREYTVFSICKYSVCPIDLFIFLDKDKNKKDYKRIRDFLRRHTFLDNKT
jgi:hypothetical protein